MNILYEQLGKSEGGHGVLQTTSEQIGALGSLDVRVRLFI